MTRRFLICLLVVTTVLITFIACENNDTKSNTEIYWAEFTVDDSVDLDSILTTEYDLEEMRSFFEVYSQNENWNDDAPILTISEANQRFPIEVLRSGHYSVYKIRDGGYFYVFWSQLFEVSVDEQGNMLFDDENNIMSEPLEPTVYFSVYLSSPLKESDFNLLIMGESTAEDVANIDPSFEFNRLLSRGRFSLSLLEDGKVIEIEYDVVSPYESRSDAVVVDMQVVELKDSISSFSRVLDKDMPW